MSPVGSSMSQPAASVPNRCFVPSLGSSATRARDHKAGVRACRWIPPKEVL